jgi:hypothetical protein
MGKDDMEIGVMLHSDTSSRGRIRSSSNGFRGIID